jgi:hypothetical protein
MRCSTDRERRFPARLRPVGPGPPSLPAARRVSGRTGRGWMERRRGRKESERGEGRKQFRQTLSGPGIAGGAGKSFI